MSTESVINEIAVERCRQIEVEGYSPQHDDTHHSGRHYLGGEGELALAAAAYAVHAAYDRSPRDGGQPLWPWDHRDWKPKDRRRNLVRAAALIVAEIERLDRAEEGGR